MELSSRAKTAGISVTSVLDKEVLGMEPDDNRPAGTQSATGVAQPTEAVMCALHLTASSRLRGEERSAKRQKASGGAALDSQNRPSAVSGWARNLKCRRHFNLEAANPGSPLGEPTCTLPTKSESVVVGYYALKKRVSSGASVRKTNRKKGMRRWQETTERTGEAANRRFADRLRRLLRLNPQD